VVALWIDRQYGEHCKHIFQNRDYTIHMLLSSIHYSLSNYCCTKALSLESLLISLLRYLNCVVWICSGMNTLYIQTNHPYTRVLSEPFLYHSGRSIPTKHIVSLFKVSRHKDSCPPSFLVPHHSFHPIRTLHSPQGTATMYMNRPSPV
jgi:hypothetical protein